MSTLTFLSSARMISTPIAKINNVFLAVLEPVKEKEKLGTSIISNLKHLKSILCTLIQPSRLCQREIKSKKRERTQGPLKDNFKEGKDKEI